MKWLSKNKGPKNDLYLVELKIKWEVFKNFND